MSTSFDTPPVALAPKKHRKWPWITGIVVVAVVGISLGLSREVEQNSSGR